MNYLLLVNKEHSLSPSYVPNNLVRVENRKKDKPNLILLLDKVVYKKFNEMVKLVYQEMKYDIICDSAYRSFKYQEELYNNLIKEGKETKYQALPGASEHQTGLCVDVAAYQNGNYVDETKFLTKEYEWLAKNAHRFGFVLRYPKGKENITGYPYEPWHFRYVGEYHAKIMKKENKTLEEYLEK